MNKILSIALMLLLSTSAQAAQSSNRQRRENNITTETTLRPVITKPTPRVVDMRPVRKGERPAPAETPEPERRTRRAPEPAAGEPAPPDQAPPTVGARSAARVDRQLADMISAPASRAARDRLRAYVVNHANPAQSVPALMRIAGISAQLGDWEDASTTYQSVIQLAESPAGKALAREGAIDALLHVNKVEQAEAIWTDLARQTPDHVLNPATAVGIGMMLAMQGKPADANKVWAQAERSLQAMPGEQAKTLRPRLELARAMAEELQGRPDEARASYQNIVSRQPQSEAAALARARIADLSRPLTLTAPAATANP